MKASMRIFFFATLRVAALVMTGGGEKEEPVMPEVGDSVAAPVDLGVVQPSAEDTARLLTSLPAPYNTADLVNGQRQSALCRACHTFTEGGPDLTGPNLHGVFGRRIGTKAGFAYSEPAKQATFAWDAAHLEQWLANPQTFMPGTKMTFLGIKEPKDRNDLIAYLKVQTGYSLPAAVAPVKAP